MEATAAARGASLTMHSPQLSRQEWRAVADNHSARDTADEVGLPRIKGFFLALLFFFHKSGNMDSNVRIAAADFSFSITCFG